MPIMVSLRPVLNSPSAPILKSQASIRKAPMAIQCPVDTPITGVGKAKILRAISEPLVVSAIAASGPLPISLRSNPPEKSPGRPWSITIASAASALSKASPNSSHTVCDRAFTLPSSIVIVATPSLQL